MKTPLTNPSSSRLAVHSLALLSTLLSTLLSSAALASPSLRMQSGAENRPWALERVQPETCTLPDPGGCNLSLSPGPLNADVASNAVAGDAPLLLPEDRADLMVATGVRTERWVGLGLLSGGVLATAVAIFFGAQASEAAHLTPAGAPNDALTYDAAMAITSGVVSLVLYATGGALAGMGLRTAPETSVAASHDAQVPVGLVASSAQ